MPDNGSIQKRGAHEMAHGRPVQITEHTTVTELQPSLRRYQNLGLHHRGHRSKERKRTGAHDLVRGAVCGHYRAAG